MTPMPSPPAAKPDGKIGLLFQSFPDHWCNRWSSILQCHTLLVEQLNFTPEKRPKLLSYLAIIPLMEKQHLASSKSKPEKKAIRINMKNKVWVRTICTSAASHPSFFLSKTTSTTWYLSAGGGQSPAIKRFPFMFYDIVLLQLLASGSLLAKIIGPWRLCINM